MKPTRSTTLAALVFVALAVPVTAYAVSAGADDPTLPEPATAHATETPDPPEAPETTGTEHAAEASAPGRAHAEAMKAWAQCVGEAASGPKTEGAPVPPKLSCGDKPVGPGRAKHAPAAGPAQHGSSGAHGNHGRGH